MSPDQIQLSALKGEGELKNLELNEEVLTELLGMISHKKSLKTIFGHKHKIKNFIKNFDIFHKKNSTAIRFWFIFGIKFQILKQNYFKNEG